MKATPPNARIAIVGAGGGRQVRFAQQLGGTRRIVAIELEPAVFDAVRRPEHLRARFRHVYEHPRVTPVRGEARRFLRDHPEPFDLIYLPSVGGYAQMMIEPGNMVRTFEAHRLMRDRLTAGGMLALWYPVGLDSGGVLTTHYVRTLRALGMPTSAYRNAVEWLVLAHKDARAVPPDSDALQALVGGRVEGPGAADLEPEPFPVEDEPGFRPITDEKPFLAGNVRHILSIPQVITLLGISLAVLGGFGVLTLLGLGSRWNRDESSGQAFPGVAAQALLIGANFLMLEHLLVMSLFRRLFVFDDALGLGAVAFLSLTALGSVLPRLPWLARAPLAALGLAGLVTLSLLPGTFRTEAILILVLPAALLTGQFFPALFDRCARNPLPVFARDAVGAGLGALLATFVPILWGFQAFFLLTALVFVATLCGHAWFYRSGQGLVVSG